MNWGLYVSPLAQAAAGKDPILLLHAHAPPAAAQAGNVIRGRVEDAASRIPIAEARVFSADSSTTVFTDSTGGFTIELQPGEPLSIHVEQLGYLGERFDLPEEAPTRISVLLLEPAPIELPGVDVQAETSLSAIIVQLANRRNVYPGAVTAFDRTLLESRAPIGSAWDFFVGQLPQIVECQTSVSGLCLGDRVPIFEHDGIDSDPPPVARVPPRASTQQSPWRGAQVNETVFLNVPANCKHTY